MKKLLIDANPVVPYYVFGKVNGIGRTTMELIQALAQVPDLPFEVMLYSQNMKGIGGRNMHVPFKCRHLYLPNRRNVNKVLAHLPVREMLTDYDLMHITHNFEYVHSPGRCIVTIHDALFMKMQEKAFEHNRMRLEVPPFARKCKHIITCSEASKQDIVETMQIEPEKVTVIYWGVKHEMFHPLRLDKEEITRLLRVRYPNMPAHYFLSVSCNAERKRTHILVQQYIELCRQKPVNDLVLVWETPPTWLLEQINNSKAAGRIHFLTNVTDQELALLYNGATASFMPSLYEGFGLPVLEAMSCGTPVVTCRNSSLEEIGGDAAIYLTEPIEASLLKTMENLGNNSIDTVAFRQKGLERSAQFHWERTAKAYIKLYQNLLGV